MQSSHDAHMAQLLKNSLILHWKAVFHSLSLTVSRLLHLRLQPTVMSWWTECNTSTSLQQHLQKQDFQLVLNCSDYLHNGGNPRYLRSHWKVTCNHIYCSRVLCDVNIKCLPYLIQHSSKYTLLIFSYFSQKYVELNIYSVFNVSRY